MFVYLIVNDVNLKIYVGKTISKNLQLYFQKKLWDAEHPESSRGNSHLFASVRKYGREHFHIFPLFEGQTNEEICVHEKLLIKVLAVQNSEIGYNICRGGEGRMGSHTAETIVKISKSNKITKSDQKYRAKASETMKQTWRINPQNRIRLSESTKNKWSTPEFRAKASGGIKQRYITDPNYRSQISEAGKKQWIEADPIEQVKRVERLVKATKRRWVKYREETKELTAQIVNLHQKGWTQRAIAHELSIGKSTVHSRLKQTRDY
jgi:hypothetical protein